MGDSMFGLFLGSIGAFFIFGAIKTIADKRRLQGFCIAVWGGWALTFGVLHIAKGLGHPFMTDETQGTVFLIGTPICMIALIGFADKKDKNRN